MIYPSISLSVALVVFSVCITSYFFRIINHLRWVARLSSLPRRKGGSNFTDLFWFLRSRYLPSKYDKSLFNDLGWFSISCGVYAAIFVTKGDIAKFFLSNSKSQDRGFPAQIAFDRIQNLSNLAGKGWRERRKMMIKPFRAEVVQTMIPKIVKYAQLLVSELGSRNNPVAIQSIIRDHVLMNILETSFGLDESSQWYGKAILKEKLKNWIDSQTNRTGYPLLWFQRINRLFLTLRGQQNDYNTMMSLMSNLIESTLHNKIFYSGKSTFHDRNNNVPQPFLAHLIDSFNQSQENGDDVNISKICDEMLATMINSMEGTASAIMWTLFCLANHPQIQEKLYQELITFQDGDPNVTLSEINSFTYLDQCIKETLRLYPSGGFMSTIVEEELALDGCVLPKDALILIAVFIIQRDEDVFPSPEMFDPDRFLPENETKIPQGSYIPFGIGPRSCVGKIGALTVIKLFVAHIIKIFELVPVHPENVEPVRFDSLPLPNKPIEIYFRHRSSDFFRPNDI